MGNFTSNGQYIYGRNNDVSIIPGNKGGLRSRVAVINHFIVYQSESSAGVWVDKGGHGDPDNAIVTGGQCRMGVRGGNWCVDIELQVGGFVTNVEDTSWKCVHEIQKWNPQVFNDLNLWVKTDSRSGLTLTDSINPANSPTILPSYLSKPSGDEVATVFDNGALDIGSQDLTLCGWFNATSSYKTLYQFLCGKQASGQPGQYGFFIEQTTGFYGVNVRSSGGYVIFPSTVDYSTAGWCFLSLKIVVATKKITFKINNVQIGVDQDYIGTLPALANGWGFNLGAQQTSVVPAYNLYARASYSDIRVYHSALTDEQLTTLYNRGYVAGAAAHWPCNSWNINDVIGGYHMTGININSTKIGYSSYGSRQPIDKGYSSYRHLGVIDYPEIQVPYNDNEEAVVSPLVPTGYTLFGEFPADELNHNLANCRVQFVGDEWDRSDATVFGEMARLGHYVSTDDNTKKQFHISELNKNILNSFYNPLYKGIAWVKIDNNTVTDRRKLKEIFTFSDNKTGADYIICNSYCGDHAVSQYIDTYIDSKNIVTQNGLKALQFNTTTKVLSLSLDNGATFAITKDLTGVCDKVLRAKIYENGNILFCDDTKAYYSNDNLSTYQESTVLAEDGDPYVPSTYDNFSTLTENDPIIINGVEMDIFGVYSVQVGTRDVNINVWYSIDSGVTFKSAYKFGVSLPALIARHVHAVSYNHADGYFWVQTGDGANTVNWMKGLYDFDTDTWTWTSVKVSDGESYWKTCGIGFYSGYMYWCNDSAANYGVWKNADADVLDNTKFYRLSSSLTQLTCLYNDFNGTMIVTGNDLASASHPIIHISTDSGATWVKYCLIGLPNLAASYFLAPIISKNNVGYYLIELVEDTENITEWRCKSKLMLKIVK